MEFGYETLNPPSDGGQVLIAYMTPKQFHHACTNTLERTAADEAYERYHAPGPNRTVYQVAFANLFGTEATRVDFGREVRAPLLLVAGGKDHIFPVQTIESNYKSLATRRR